MKRIEKERMSYGKKQDRVSVMRSSTQLSGSGGRAGERLIIRSGLRLNDGQGGTRENEGYSGLQVNTKWGLFSKLDLSHFPGRRKEAGLSMSSTRQSLKGSHFVYGMA